MAKMKQANLFEEDLELTALREREKRLKEAHKEVVKLPARLERERRDRESTMPPMAEIEERQQINRFERNLSRGQIENVLRTQRQSLAMMLLLTAATVLMLFWAYRIMIS
ncbi:MAG: hypothetical protein OSA84_06335 [Akkermansiaceae bacterium]|nr:hypothetical protein [Akkermansiaceae bacterium]